jgi:hypothetical protein
VYAQAGKGFAWDVKGGPREILPELEWIVSDGVNLVWATKKALYTKQPRWDLPDLESEPSAFVPGSKPLAMGCGRVLQKTESGFELCNLKAGSYWSLATERFPEDLGTQGAMDCDYAVFSSGYRIALDDLGEAKRAEAPTAAKAGAAEAPSPEVPSSGPATGQPESE